MTDDLFPPTTEAQNLSRGSLKDAISPTPWRVERTNMKGWKGISIMDAEGLAIAYMVMQPHRDNEMANARAIVAAINRSE